MKSAALLRGHALAWWLSCVLGVLGCTGQIESIPVERGSVERESSEPDASTLPTRPPPVRANAGGAGGASGVPSGGALDAGLGPRDEPDAPREPSEPVCDAVELVLLSDCGGGSCHSNANARIGNWAVGRAEAESFVDVPSVRNPECGMIIDSRDASQSLLLRKLIGDFESPKCGGPMPVATDLTDAQIACMASWVQQFER